MEVLFRIYSIAATRSEEKMGMATRHHGYDVEQSTSEKRRWVTVGMSLLHIEDENRGTIQLCGGRTSECEVTFVASA